MESGMIVDMWNTFKDSLEKKTIEATAERFIDTCADYGADDTHLRDAMGTCDILDGAINYYLDLDQEDVYEDEIDNDWDE